MAELLPKKGDVIASKYQIEGTLGTGGMGAVFEVSHRVTGKRFAVKWLLPNLTTEADAVKRFIREAQVAGRVDHPNIVEVYDVGQDGDSFFMVMELLQGKPLAVRLAEAGRFSPAEACTLLLPAMHGLAVAHKAGVIHRDLKPDNIFLCMNEAGEESPKVLDFGISKMSNLAGEVTSSITRAGVVMGTPHYMAPEQVRAKAVDARTDVYALGVILYEMLSGALPFPGDSYSDLVLKIMTEVPKPLAQVAPGTPDALVRIVTKAMAREPDARYADVSELARALTPFARGTARPSPVPAAPRREASAAASGTPTPRTHTPLSTQSERLRTGDFPQSHGKARAVVLTLLAAAAIGGVLFVINRPTPAAPDTESHAPFAPKSTPAGTVNAPAAAAAPTPSNDLPVPNTVRIAPEPGAPARVWEPPPGSTEAPRPVEDPDAVVTPLEERKPGSDDPRAQVEPAARPRVQKARTPVKSKAGDAPEPTPTRTKHRTLGLSLDDF